MDYTLEDYLSEKEYISDEYNESISEITFKYAHYAGFKKGVMIKLKHKPNTSIIEDLCVMSPLDPFKYDNTGACHMLVHAISTDKNYWGDSYDEYFDIEDIELAKEEYIVPEYVKKPNSPKAPKPTWIYLMKDEVNGFYKIGHSKNPDTRERTLQSEKPTIVMLYQTQGTVDIEKKLHEIYDAKRVRGEWFSLTEDEVKGFPELIETIKLKKPE